MFNNGTLMLNAHICFCILFIFLWSSSICIFDSLSPKHAGVARLLSMEARFEDGPRIQEVLWRDCAWHAFEVHLIHWYTPPYLQSLFCLCFTCLLATSTILSWVFRMLVRRFPDLAEKVMDACITQVHLNTTEKTNCLSVYFSQMDWHHFLKL